jgi:hypothetical protein
MRDKWGVTLKADPMVLKESAWEPLKSGKPAKFNSDFILDFVEDFTAWPGSAGTMNTILPNTFGAEAYLYVDTAAFAPLHFEVMAGAAFSIKYYAPYIERVETAIRDAVLSQQGIDRPSQQALLRRVPLRKSACARVLVVGGDVCFLYFPSDGVPVMRGSQFDLAESNDCHIACYLDGAETVCFDGWIRTEVTHGERVLVAQPV